MREIAVREYRGRRKYEKELAKMLSQGWQVSNVSERGPGCMEQFFSLGWARPYYTVTYQRDTIEQK